MEGVSIKIPVDQGKFVIVEKNQTLRNDTFLGELS